ncbi:hypothetical protein [Streptomyces sp. MZ04]|uniref:hypothetical protein n=1 Tax=Streptomyces sp. MZ04 TaxID=2559236 RepID=UPI00107ED7BD|nr:hypothetical protein [Streptomyces sp. MZ04]TGB13821.1 hypothetical protein E2651_07705 [Streptomyces sp. MZ04]
MTHRASPRIRLTAGGPTFKKARATPGGSKKRKSPKKTRKFSKKQLAARKPLDQSWRHLYAAVGRRDWPAGRVACAAVSNEINQLAANLTLEDRHLLLEYRQRIGEGEARDRGLQDP